MLRKPESCATIVDTCRFAIGVLQSRAQNSKADALKMATYHSRLWATPEAVVGTAVLVSSATAARASRQRLELNGFQIIRV